MSNLYPWLDSNFTKFSRSLKNSPHHAYVVTGAHGLGKQNLVNNVIKHYLCENEKSSNGACGVCKSCQLIAANNHPDIHVVDDKDYTKDKINTVIKINQIRQLTQSLASTAQIAKTKIVIINPADKLNKNAANSLLKTLEEPQGDSLMFLITAKPFALPATILSRCIKFAVLDINKTKALEWLTSKNVLKTDAEVALKLSHYAPLNAQQFLQDDLSSKRLACFELFKQICLKKKNLGSLSQWVSKEKLEINTVIQWIESWLSDISKLSLGINHKDYLHNIDLYDALMNIQQSGSIKNSFKQQQRTAKIAVLEKTGLNETLLLTDLLANIVMD